MFVNVGTRIDYSPKALIAARRKRVGNGGLTPRVRQVVDAVVDGTFRSFQEACEGLGTLTWRAMRMALQKPQVLAYYKQQVRAYREAQLAANARTLAGIRDDPTLSSAAGARARIAAIAELERPEVEPNRPGINVNVGINVQSSPGYQIDVTRFDPTEVARILAASGSRESVLHDRARTIDGEAEEIFSPPRGPHARPPGA